MSIKKTMALAGMLVILGAGLALAQTQTTAGDTNMARNRVQNQVQDQLQNKSQFRTSGTAGAMFYDENGDGICDGIRDHDNDGVPNGQDADWQAPKDGTGYKGPARTPASGGQFQNGSGFRGGSSAGSAAFRRGTGSGTGICDGTGPKGAGTRRGRS
jgi:hypothetical protein